MAYNFYPTGYQPVNYIQNGASSNQSALIWVNGEVGAKSYLVAPNSTVVLWDTESPTVYIKSADTSGMPSIKTLDYTMRGDTANTPDILATADFATKEDILHIKEEIEALKRDLKVKKSKTNEG